jgi:Mg-chelatase subunit ChlD
MHHLDLVATGEAAHVIDGLGEREAGPKRSWAVRIARESVLATLEIAAPEQATLVIDVEMSAPTCFRKDARYVEVPQSWATKIDKKLVHTDATEAIDRACPANNMRDEHAWLALPATELAHGAPPAGRIGTSAHALTVHGEKFARVELDLASRLGEVPRDLATAIVIDGSRSMNPQELAAQRAVVEAYLRGAPQTRVQVIAFAHTARALLPGWTTASQALARVDRELRDLDQRNGSNVDAGLAAAATWLARTPGTHRILLFTDERLAKRFTDLAPDAIGKLAPADTTVHVIAVNDDESPLSRDEAMTLAPLAKASTGIAVRSGLPQGGVDASMLLRPITVDHIAVTAPGWTELAAGGASCATVEVLDEGTSCTWWGTSTPNAGPITVDGFVWGQRVTRVMQPDLGHRHEVARELVETASLGEAIVGDVELAAHAVTERFNLIAVWGGHDGYADAVHGGWGFGMSGCSCGGGDVGTIGHGGFGTIGLARHLDLKEQLSAATAACDRDGHTTVATVETTGDEIVDLAVDVIHDAHESVTAIHDCIETAIWDTAITIPDAPPHATTIVTL